MSDTVITVENLGKKYIIGHQKQEKYTALRDVITNGVKSIFTPNSQNQNSQEEFWALNDISFEIKQGDRVGIIGRNGAGKSTLLKVLSRITEPTKGQIKIKGRVASLLEVGTGFHPELTGRENIFLNGAILGMGKIEIKKKFDEIVAFAEVEKFLDTPVKRYSSGMYVRLAFAVAAHLEPEILVVDEVLAVGDAAFQKKCLGKMQDVANKEGKTVLFVSHNMGTVQQLCTSSIFLDRGQVVTFDNVEQVVAKYLHFTSIETSTQTNLKRTGNKKIIFKDFYTSDRSGKFSNIFSMGDDIYINFTLYFQEIIKEPVVAIQIKNHLNEQFAHLINLDDDFHIKPINKGDFNQIKVKIPKVFLSPSQYILELWVGENMNIACDYIYDCMSIEIIQSNKIKRLTPYPSHLKIFLNSEWEQIA
ncbi:MAG: ABC transporter ATP-binding protein [Xenococcaceae cyanobacterium MO_188.B19]|nr:ABC transporter ATP-binding protein [Xenococcaceae cyanobacterium MO_188.B19]